MSLLDKKYLLTINLDESSVQCPLNMFFFNTDKNTANLYVKVQYRNEVIEYLSQTDSVNYNIKLTVIKPKTNTLREIEGIVTNEFNEEYAIYKFELPSEFTDQVGTVACEFTIINANEILTINPFSYTINASKVTGLNPEIVLDPDLPILKQLIEDVKSAQQWISNIDDKNVSEVKTYSNKKIEDKFTAVGEQFNTNMNLISQIGFNFIQQGGKNDRVTDNTPILQSLINTLSIMGGGNIYIPDGTYFFGRTAGKDYAVEVASNVNIYGAGIGKTILKIGYGNSSDGEGYSLFYFIKSPSSITYIENCIYRDFTVDGYNMTMTQYSHKGKAFYMQNVRNAIFENLELKGTPSTALGIDFLHNVHISKVHCYECGRLWVEEWVYNGVNKGRGPGGAGIGIGTGNLVDENFTISDCITDKCGHFGIFLEHQGIFNVGWHNKDAKGVTISNCITKNGRYGGLGLRGGTNVNINNCISYGNKLGIRVDSVGGVDETINSIVKITNCNINNSIFSENTLDGIMITGDIPTENLTISNNTINYNQQNGISVGKNGKNFKNINTLIKNNNISNNGYSGILVETTVEYENLNIDSNLIVSNNSYGIFDKGTSRNSSITQNKILNNKTYGIYLYGSKTHYVVSNNYSVRDTLSEIQQEYGLFMNYGTLTYATISNNDFRRNDSDSIYIAKSCITSTTLLYDNLVDDDDYRLETSIGSYAEFPSKILKNSGTITIRLKFKINAFDETGTKITSLVSLTDEITDGASCRGFVLHCDSEGIIITSNTVNTSTSYNTIRFSTNITKNTEYNLLVTVTSSDIAMTLNDSVLSKTIEGGTLQLTTEAILNSYSYNDRLLLSNSRYKKVYKSLGDVDFYIFNVVSSNTYQYTFGNIGVNKTIRDAGYGVDGKSMNKSNQNYLLN